MLNSAIRFVFAIVLIGLSFWISKPVSAQSMLPDSNEITHKVMILTSEAAPKLRPQRVRQMNNAGVRFGQKQRWQNAQSVFTQIQNAVPNDTTKYNLALTSGFLKNYDDALALWPAENIGRRATQNKGTLYAQTGQIDQALSLWNVAPRTDTLCFNLALAYYRKQDLDESINWSRGFGFSKNGLFHELYANLLYRQGKFKEAEKFYEKSEKTQHNIRLLVQLGNARLAQHEYAAAEELFLAYLDSKQPFYRFEARLGLGHVYYRKRKYREAVFEYDAACLLSSQSVEAWTSLGNAHLGMEGNRQAQKAFERAIALKRTHKPAWLGLAVVFYRTKKYTEAICCFDEADTLMDATNRNHADLFAIRGFCHLYAGQTKASKPDIDIAVRLQPKGLLSCMALSEFLRIEQYFLSSLKWLERAIKYNNAASVKMLVNRANIYLKCKEYDDALDDFMTAHHKDPNNLNACNGLGICWLNKNEIDKAKYLYDSLLKKKTVAMLLNNRGIVEAYMAMRSRQENNKADKEKFEYLSLHDFERGLAVDTSKHPYHVNIGNIHKSQDKDAQAIESYQKHLSKNAINNLGVLFARSPRRDFATHYLNTAVNLDTANQIYRYNRAKAYRDNFKADYARRPDFQQDFKNAPTGDIAVKYSPDGFVTIYLYDYDFEKYEFPGEPLMDVRPQPIDDFAYLLSPDFVSMRGEGAKLKPENELNYVVSPKPNRFKEAPFWRRGSTACPVL